MKLANHAATAFYLISTADYQFTAQMSEPFVNQSPTEVMCQNYCDSQVTCKQYIYKIYNTQVDVFPICWISPDVVRKTVAKTFNSYPTSMSIITGQKMVVLFPISSTPYEACYSSESDTLEPCSAAYARVLAGFQTIGIPYFIALANSYDPINKANDYVQPQCQTEAACRISCTYNFQCFQYIFQNDKTSGIKTCYNLPYIAGVTLYSNPVPSTVSIVVGEKAWSLASPILSSPASRKNVKGRTLSPGANQYYASCVSKGLSQSDGTESADSSCAAAYQKLVQAKLCASGAILSPC